jgi:hypothetical protein
MPKIVLGDNKSEGDRIKDRLKPSSDETLLGWPPDSVTETVPTRTISSVFYGATQSSTTKQPLRSNPGAVGAGTFFTDSEDDFNKTYGLNKPKGLTLNGSLFKRR